MSPAQNFAINKKDQLQFSWYSSNITYSYVLIWTKFHSKPSRLWIKCSFIPRRSCLKCFQCYLKFTGYAVNMNGQRLWIFHGSNFLGRSKFFCISLWANLLKYPKTLIQKFPKINGLKWTHWSQSNEDTGLM